MQRQLERNDEQGNHEEGMNGRPLRPPENLGPQRLARVQHGAGLVHRCLLTIAGVGLGDRSDICEFEWTMQRKHHAVRSAPGGLPAYRQVYRRIRSEILSGRLAAGARLTSSRTLASELGIARGTVVTAFQMLAGEGYTVSAGARGTVVNVALRRAGKSRPSAEPAETDGKLRRSISTPPAPLLFRVGLPALDAFPR